MLRGCTDPEPPAAVDPQHRPDQQQELLREDHLDGEGGTWDEMYCGPDADVRSGPVSWFGTTAVTGGATWG